MKAHSLNPLLLHMFGRTYIVTIWFDSGFFVSAKWDTSGFDPFIAVLGAIVGPIGAARAYALPRVSFGLGAAYGAY